MNKKEIILDFTSLLDVILIILFFFIIFSHFESEEIKANLDSQKSSVEAKEKEYDKKLKEAENYLNEAKQADERQAENVDGINEFSNSDNIRIYLKMESDDDWSFEIYKGENKKSIIKKEVQDNLEKQKEDFVEQMLEILNELNYNPDKTILCEFIYDSTEIGTSKPYKIIYSGVINLIREYFPHFYLSEIDKSK